MVRQLIKGSADNHWSVQFFQHLVTGGIATAAHYLVMWLALHFGAPATVATTAGFAVGATIRFILAYWHIFQPETAIRPTMARFLLVLLLQMAANAALLALGMQLGLYVWIAQIITTAILVIANFIAQKYWVFR